ncbi:Protein of unknown function DUF2495 [Thermocrinis albus DSM 14484]|uniref:Phosphate-starvation-inducible E-like protein n=1 Tax=Thermocrinis albus (strain DSM 14484 / JCM 11386 / HI 11/12) TaxID=638303 RepID=D3SMV3_THEAH|nr:phosphate-starvation-inducible PsiE family protein [Thermocrinis albus]ADC90083.1 Protein of unknown function DUF2495 [Thermocrinis albus DSM 14484]
MQELILGIYRFFIRLAFNLTIVVLLVGLFVGVFRTLAEIGLTFTEATVRLGFKELIINTLSLIVVLEIIRAFVDYFEYERVRLEVLMEALIAFFIREFMIKLFEEKLTGLEVLLWSTGVAFLVGARTLTVVYKPPKK